jgi:hypothetical protein
MTESAEPAVKPLGLLARIIGMIPAPRPTFENVVTAPRPVGILLVCALVIGFTQMFLQMDPRVQQATLDMQVQTIEKISGKPLPAEARENMERRAKATVYFTPLGSLIVMPIFCLIGAAIYWVIFNAILGGTAAFKQVLAVVTHSQVITALGVLAAAPIQFSQGVVTAGGPFNFSALVPSLPDNSIVKLILSATNVFTIWGVIVAAIGLAVLYRRKTLNIAIGLFAVYFLIAFGFASLFAGFMGGR